MSGKPPSKISFHFGLEEIRVAYRTTREGSKSTQDRAATIVRERFGLSPDDPIDDDELDDVGMTAADHFSDYVTDVHQDAHASEAVVRKFFVILLAHFWEKQTNKWLGLTSYNHEKAMAYLEGHGVTPYDAELARLWKLSNCLKHGPGSACQSLRHIAPNLFSAESDPSKPASDEDIVLDDADVDALFEAVFRSGPRLGKAGKAI